TRGRLADCVWAHLLEKKGESWRLGPGEGGVCKRRKPTASLVLRFSPSGLRQASSPRLLIFPPMSRIVYVNGSYVPEADAKVSVFDRAFLFADGVYEVTAVLSGRPLVLYRPFGPLLPSLSRK